MDRDIIKLIEEERVRQNGGIELIASENYPSRAVMAAQGSILTDKYAEGYPGRRYYGGCEVVDQVETLAVERAKKLFGVGYANVQPHSGSQANFAAYRAMINPGDKVLALTLDDGGHLTHGSNVSFSGNLYEFHFYPLGEDGRIDYDRLSVLLDEVNPALFLAGYSAYPFEIDFARMRRLIDEHDARKGTHTFFMVDMAHIAGIVAAGLCDSPCQYADVVTSTTHKTLRGPRGGLILSNNESLYKKLNSAVFPYAQGGPLEHVIAGKAVAFGEALHPSFKTYMEAVLKNTYACSDELEKCGAEVSGTENHLFLCNVLKSYGITGKEAQNRLGSIGITVNKNMIHADTMPPSKASGIRVGFAAATSRGCTEEEARHIARILDAALRTADTDELDKLKEEVSKIAKGWKDIASLDYPSIAE